MAKRAKGSKTTDSPSDLESKIKAFVSLFRELESEMTHAESDDDDFDCMLELLPSAPADAERVLEVELFRRKDGKVGRLYAFLKSGRVLRFDDIYPHPQEPPEPMMGFPTWEVGLSDLLDSLRSIHRRRLERLNLMGSALEKASQLVQ